MTPFTFREIAKGHFDCFAGIFTRSYGEPEKIAVKASRYRMVDEKKAVAFQFKAASTPFRNPNMGYHGR